MVGRDNEDWLNDEGRYDPHGVPWYGPDDRADLVATVAAPAEDGGPRSGVFVKRARIVALQMDRPFKVSTDHGAIGGIAGDWLATNHPDDDPTSDVWPIGAARFEASYEPASPARNRFRPVDGTE